MGRLDYGGQVVERPTEPSRIQHSACRERCANVQTAPQRSLSTFLWPNLPPACTEPVAYHPLPRVVQSNNLQQRISSRHSESTDIVSYCEREAVASITEADSTQARNQFEKGRPARQRPDGSAEVSNSPSKRTMPITSRDVAAMAGSSREGLARPFPARPQLASHHSNSVPSTPLQHPRDVSSRSRSPSPHGGLGSHSPRSVSSEANGPMTTLRKPRTACKFESGLPRGRRRFGYDKTDILDKVEGTKVALSSEEEDKLSGDMRELYDRLLPSDESQIRRTQLLEKMKVMLQEEWPGNEFKIHMFGSSGNMLCTSDSDVDICIQTRMEKLESMCMLAAALAKRGMERVVCIATAKVPIARFWDPVLRLACDINVNNTLALENTRMIKTYVQIDDRVRPLAMIIKHWTNQRRVNDAAIGATLSSYAWICMILNFLQTRTPPILPILHEHPGQGKRSPQALETSDFADDLETLCGFGKANNETIGQLLFQFFRHYGHEIDYSSFVISVRHGKLLTRKEKGWDIQSLSREGHDRLCIEEPFSTTRNLGNSADDYSFRGLHLEIRRAFDLLADGGQLTGCCEQYEFPLEEKTVFKRPTPVPRPVLSLAAPQPNRGGRGGPGGRGGRNNAAQKQNQGFRRASSGAPALPNGRHQFLHSPSAGLPGHDYFGNTRAHNLHDQLAQQYQFLEMQQNTLKAQLYAQYHHQQQHAHSAAQSHGRASTTHNSPQKQAYLNGMPSPRTLDNPPNTAPLFPGYMYPYPGLYDQSQPMSQSVSQDGSRTNPSSPSLTARSPELRRTMHRASVTSGSQASSIRSQSQPARGMPTPVMVPGYSSIPMHDALGIIQYQAAVAQNQHRDRQSSESQMSASRPPTMQLPVIPVLNHGIPKEYVGYYVGESPRLQPQYVDQTQYSVPALGDLAQRRQKISPDLMGPLFSRRVSRSPSPLGHIRSQSTGLRSAPLPSAPTPLRCRQDSLTPPDEGGLVIVNGSNPSASTRGRARALARDDSYQGEESPFVSSSRSSSTHVPDHAYTNAGELYQQHPVNGMPYKDEVELARMNIADGTNGQTPVGAPQIPGGFPTLGSQTNEVWYTAPTIAAGDLGLISAKTSPSYIQSPARMAPLSKQSIAPLDLTSSTPHVFRDENTVIAPLLSPVPETRTPSPTANRRPDNGKQARANGVNMTINGTSTKGSSTPAPPRIASTAKEPQKPSQQNQPKKTNQMQSDGTAKPTTGSSSNGNTWQHSNGSKKKSNRQRANSKSAQKSATDIKTQGQPLPANVADRKGG